MSDIKQTYEIAAAPAEVWRALTDPRIIEEWSGARANFPLEVGAAYALWDGTIGGEIVEIVHGQKLAQTWKPQDWTRTDSVVTFTLTPRGNGTRVDLLHVNVEESDYDGTTEGWDIYYLGAIKRMFEASAGKTRDTKTAKKPKAAKNAAKKKSPVKPSKKPAKKKVTAKRKARK
ncbi:MAG TPA: SRPBCC domain-containing protein [Anaerolineae bacterium]